MKGKITALLLAAVLIVAMAVPALAADNYTLTINNTVSGHTYTAYQIFKGTKANADSRSYIAAGDTYDETATYYTLSGKDYVVASDVTAENYADNKANLYVASGNVSLGDVTWGADITDAGKKALYVAYNMSVAEADINKPAKIQALVEAIASASAGEGEVVNSESDRAVKFANVFFTTAENGVTTAKTGLLQGPTGGKAINASGTSVAFNKLASGYYIVNDTYSAEGKTAGKDYSIARIAVQVVGDTTINNKADKPTLDKKIDGTKDEDSTTTGDTQGNTVGIGGKVPYKLTSKVPELDGYENYFYVVNDKMTEGLTFNDDVAIKIGNTTLTNALKDVDMEDSDAVAAAKADTGAKFYVVTEKDGTDTKIKIVVNNFIQYKGQTGDAITITYSATVNEKAKVDETSNKNTASLTYSNNPLDDGRGEPGTPNEPSPGDVTGKTPDSKTDTFATKLIIKKIDGVNETTLTGAKFKVTGTKHETALVNSTKYVKDNTGTFYMLKDGTYTETAPVTTEEGYTADKYDSTTQMYKQITTIDKTTVGTDKTFEAEGYVNAQGVLTITGLSEGEYTIEELVAPSGYNLLTDKVTVALAYTYDADAGTITWAAPAKLADKTNSNPVAYDKSQKAFTIDIENNQGTELPSTGGMGTTVLYVVGAIIIIGAGVLLITRRRANAAK